jgi:hypothetical protein
MTRRSPVPVPWRARRRDCRHRGSRSRSRDDDSRGTAASSVARAGGRYALKRTPIALFWTAQGSGDDTRRPGGDGMAVLQFRATGRAARRFKRMKSTTAHPTDNKYYAGFHQGRQRQIYRNDKIKRVERHLEQYGDWAVSEFGEDGRRSRLITSYVFDPDKFRRHEPGWCGTSITEYRNGGMPSRVTLLDAAGLEVGHGP